MGFNIERVNFGKYFEDNRKRQGITLDELSEGLCNRALLTKIECGERVSSMLLRDRLIERMGTTSDEYEKYVKVEEFKMWKNRIKIVDAISGGYYAEAKVKLEEYKSTIGEDVLEEQFYLDMKAMMAKLEGSDEAAEYAEQALRKTVCINKSGIITSKRLAPKEINLIIEYSMKLEKSKRYIQLSYLLRYAEECNITDRYLVLFYPKLVFTYINEYINDYDSEIGWLFRSYEMLNKAMRCLAETGRLLYVLELSKIKERIFEHILGIEKCEDTRYYALLSEQKKECDAGKKLWIELGAEFDVDMSTNDWCYLYKEEGVRCIGDVVRKRRNMIGMSKGELCDDICSLDTLERVERLEVNPQPVRMKKMFEKLGLLGEYQKTYVSVSDQETKKCEEDISRYGNRKEYDNCLKELAHLKLLLKDKSPEDNQFILMTESMIKFRKKEIDTLECEMKLRRALQYTLPKFELFGDIYLTRIEMNCIYNLVMIRKSGDVERLQRFVFETSRAMLDDISLKDTRVMELLLLALGEIQLDRDEFEAAEQILDKLIRMELKEKRNVVLLPSFNKRALLYNKETAAGHTVPVKKIERNLYFLTTLRKYIKKVDNHMEA